MKAIGIAAVVIALAGPAAAQQTQQGNQSGRDTTAGAAQNDQQNDRATQNDTTSPQNQSRQADQGAAGTAGQNDRATAGAAGQNNAELPATASPLAAIGMVGLLSLAGGTVLRRLRAQ